MAECTYIDVLMGRNMLIFLIIILTTGTDEADVREQHMLVSGLHNFI